MSVDKRSNARGAVTAPSADTRFVLKSEDGVYTITRVRNVSLSGVGIETRYRLRRGERVVLKYRCGDLLASVTGTVAWCSGGTDQVFTIGVAFTPDDNDRNSLFLLALGKYLEEDAVTRPRLPSC